MSDDRQASASLVDLVFPLSGRSLPREHAQPLLQALLQELPWLEAEPQAGVHQVKLVPGGDVQALLSQRARLLLRLPRHRVDDAALLAGRTLALADSRVRLGVPHLRELAPHATLYAPAVAAPSEDEAEFARVVAAGLAALALRSPWICGKRHIRFAAGRQEHPRTTFSLMVHTLPPADSLRLQEQGLGSFRLLGCGLFVPHKSAAAVGD